MKNSKRNQFFLTGIFQDQLITNLREIKFYLRLAFFTRS